MARSISREITGSDGLAVWQEWLFLSSFTLVQRPGKNQRQGFIVRTLDRLRSKAREETIKALVAVREAVSMGASIAHFARDKIVGYKRPKGSS